VGIASGFAGLQLHVRGEDQPAKVLFGVALGCAVLLLLSSLFGRPSARR
jgi:hypothetical protein